MVANNLPKERMVVFLDILGCRILMERMNSGDLEIFSTFLNIFNFIKLKVEGEYENVLEGIPLRKYIGCEMIMFSDSIVMSAPPEEYPHLFSNISTIANFLLSKNIMVRGAITIGQLHHEKNIIFGKGLTDAYDLERTVAKYPRILIDKKVYEFIKYSDNKRMNSGKPYITKSVCNTFYVGKDKEYSLNHFTSYLYGMPERKEKFYKEIKKSLKYLLNEDNGSPDKEKHLQKKNWLVHCFNESLPDMYIKKVGLIESKND